MRSNAVLAGYGTWVLAGGLAVHAFPAWHMGSWSMLALGSLAAVAYGIVRHRPAHPAAWWLLALALAMFGAGHVLNDLLTTVLGRNDALPSAADALFIAMYPLAAAALLLLVRHRTGGRDRASLLDALSFTVAVAPLLWIFLIDPHVHEAGAGWPERPIAIAYPLGDVLLLAVLARLLITDRRRPAALLLAVGTAGMLVSDVLHGLRQHDGPWQVGGPYDLGWIVFYGAWGAAALHPTMAELTVSRRQLPAELDLRRLTLLMATSLVVPAALLGDALTGTVRHGLMIALCSTALFLLVLLRMSGVVARHTRALERERTLRSAGASLVAATDLDAVAAATRGLVARLVPPGAAHRAALLVPADVPTRAPLDAAAASELRSAAELDDSAAEVARGFPCALVCPLVLRDHPERASPAGWLVVAADEPVLLTLRGALDVLASLAALAVERVRLVGEMSRRDTEAYFRALVHHTNDVILIVGDDGRIRDASPSTPTVLGPGSLVGTDILDLVDPRDRGAAEHALMLAARSGVSEYSTRNYRVVRTDGTRIEVEVSYRDLRTDPSVRGIVLTLRDITEQRRLQRELADRAFHDALTGLPNRVQFQDRVERALSRLGTDGNHVRAGVLLLGLDDFSLVNDAMGHAVGDELLLAVAGRLTDMLEPPHTVARLSGDEFAVLVDDVEQGDDLEQLAEHVVEAFDAPIAAAGGLAISVSVGLAGTDSTGVSDAVGPAELLRRADLALRAAKEGGKNRWRRYEADMGLAVLDRVAVRTELREALAAGGFRVQYQPIVDLGGGRTIGFEALVRWTDPRGQVVPPSQFIPVAEQTGLILPLGAWVLDRALADLADWHRQPLRHPVRVNVNVSAHQVRTADFVAQVLDALARHRVPADHLVLEITETALLADDRQVTANLAALRRHGVRIALDDFGTGFASLDYLRVHAVDSLKIDRSFVDGMESSSRQTALVRTIVHLAHALDLPVVAEGVETPAQRDALLLVGCRLAQGYLFSPPITADDARHWLHDATSVTAAAG
ncbi:GGDEF domain-containing phosphodiesterase [Pseudonocardia humida]|uniref:EAL domain-containing protein n=1 Tax=Pseudonocardia humida TaxID=2800819 RepID=A0ABT1A0X4_9PSEU|nr:GGDEF domain-containing phosphodiesterase [Pseudonocardia humida]MCO1656464.1 EAL domain-containing protein [Pseudonocardia humida]